MDQFDFVKVGALIISTLSVIVAIIAFIAINLPKRIEETVDRKLLLEGEKLKKLIASGEWKISFLTKLTAKSIQASVIDDKEIRDKNLYIIESLILLISGDTEQVKHSLEALRGKPAICRKYLDTLIEVRPNLNLNEACEKLYNETIQYAIRHK